MGSGRAARADRAAAARNERVDAGEYLFREGEPADAFYVDPRTGAVAIEMHVPGRGALSDRDAARRATSLGWSWLFPPYRVALRRARPRACALIAFDGACLRGKCDAGPGARLRAAEAASPRRSSSGCRPPGSSSWTSMALRCTGAEPAAGVRDARPRAVPRAPASGARRTTPWTLRARARRGDGAAASRPASSRWSTRSGWARCRSRSAAIRPQPAARAHRARGGRWHAGDLRRRAGRRARRARAVREHVAGRRGGRRATSSSSPAASACAPLRPAIHALLAHRERYGRADAALRRARSPTSCCTRTSSSEWRASGLDVAVTVDARRAGWHGTSAWSPRLDRRGGVRPGARRGVRVRAGGDDALRCRGAARARRSAERIYLSMERNMECGGRPLRALPAGPAARLQGRARATLSRRSGPWLRGAGPVSAAKPKLAVWKFASCDGCQLTLLDCEDELLTLAGEIEIAYFLGGHAAQPSAVRTTCRSSRARSPRRTTPSASRRCAASRGAGRRSARARRPAGSRRCATSPTSRPSRRSSTPRRTTSRRSPPRRRSAHHVQVDFELHGCPIDKAPAARGDRRLPPRPPPARCPPTASASSASGAATSA